MAASETSFTALGREWRFKFGFGALCRLEAEFDMPFALALAHTLPDISVADMGDPEKLAAAAMTIRIGHVRAILKAGLGADVSDDEAEEIMDELGLEKVRAVIAQAYTSDVASPKKGRGGGRGGKGSARQSA